MPCLLESHAVIDGLAGRLHGISFVGFADGVSLSIDSADRHPEVIGLPVGNGELRYVISRVAVTIGFHLRMDCL